MAKLHDHRLLYFIGGVLSITAAWYLYFTASNQGIREKQPALPGLSGMEPQVAEKIKSLNHMVERQPASSEAWGRLGMTLDVHGLKEEAVARYEKAAELASKDFRWPYYCAIDLKDTGSIQSLTWFARAESLNPSYLPLQIRYGRALEDFGRTEEARQHFVQALKINPNSAEAHAGLAQIALSHGDAQIAKELAVKAIDSKRDFAEAYHVLASACRRLGDSAGAQAAIDKTKSLGEKNAIVDPVYASLTAEGVSSFWYRIRGRTYMESGLYDLAYKQFETALKLHRDADAYDNLGVALQGLKRWHEAIAAHEKSIAMNPGYLNYYNLGIAYAKTGKLQDAIAEFQHSLQFKNDNSDCLYNLGVAFYKLSKYPEAIDTLTKTIAITPANPQAHFALAMCYAAEGRREEAAKESEILRRLNPELAERLIHQ